MDQAADREVLFIVARATNGCIARDGDVPWAISEDLKRFKRLTMGRSGTGMPMVMGRKTFDSLPGLLPGRAHIVLTRDPDWKAEGALTANSMEQALELAGPGDFSVIGGGEIFTLMADLASRWEITEVHEDTQGDVFMDALSPVEWVETARARHPASDNWPPYDFVTYLRPESQRGPCG
ncbi:dihydrofolate reductase [Altererythrobacter aestuarii]|uniref:Dihydrofolate reductase n=2 Tax=Alteraurantiacibacter aestuarii TaxID=650004 RepID=A0A844ZLI6_9SPHN|nr:dihydrofolate reductase [Alteraurantiacibacter aestuarii]